MLPSEARLYRPTSVGYTLVEVVVAMLISCIMVTAVIGVALSSKYSGGQKAARKVAANQGLAEISAMLKQYVTACGCVPDGGDCSACGQTKGPNTNYPTGGPESWYLSGNCANNVCITDALVPNGSDVPRYALACGNHYVKGILSTLELPPYNGYTLYTVSWPTPICSTPGMVPKAWGTPSVTFSVNWTEP